MDFRTQPIPGSAKTPVVYAITVSSMVFEGNKCRAAFPAGITAPIQYGKSYKVFAVYSLVFQMLPYLRTQGFARNVLGANMSPGTAFQALAQAAELVRDLGFEPWAKFKLINCPVLCVDETTLNIAGKKQYFHCASNDVAVLGLVHERRSKEAMIEAGILPLTIALLVHDHFMPYFSFGQAGHALCNAHQLRELKNAMVRLGLKWPEVMRKFLLDLNDEVNEAGGELGPERQLAVREEYRAILLKAEEECPPEPRPPSWKGGRHAKSTGRNLLERLLKDENETLNFMTDKLVPFTNNLVERDQRMLKVHMKISGCFRTQDTARQFALVFCYLLTCRRHGIEDYEALKLLFDGKRPPFMDMSEVYSHDERMAG